MLELIKLQKQALEARIGVPADGEWDGTREYGKTLLAGQNSLNKLRDIHNIFCKTGFNCGDDIPEEDYYPTERNKRATYSDGKEIPFNCKPEIFKVEIIGLMTNSNSLPHNDATANGLIKRSLNSGKAKSGFYYKNDGEDVDSISAVIPNGSFLKIIN